LVRRLLKDSGPFLAADEIGDGFEQQIGREGAARQPALALPGPRRVRQAAGGGRLAHKPAAFSGLRPTPSGLSAPSWQPGWSLTPELSLSLHFSLPPSLLLSLLWRKSLG